MDGSQQERQPRRRAEPEPMDEDDEDDSSTSSDDSYMEEEEPDVLQNLRFDRFQVVGARPQFQERSRVTLREAGPLGPRILRVEYRGGRVIVGTLREILEDLSDRISAEVDNLFNDWEVWWPQLHQINHQPPQQQQQQQQQPQQNGHN